ncbi:hypothetical protein BSL78_29637 [Apostichopus japonicus]|uniref:DUF1985 domain-containing protein n=1 Tax=Stichopus japonicus TaxID=307972 RepID=A0A2G8JCW7_STIJA|nr:hypothetical protein BSL78_29637 [Apostichopus japonicus]
MSEDKNYPRRLYEEGKAPIQNKSMNHNCLLGNLASVRKAIGTDVWNALRESAVGVNVKLVDSNYVLSGKTVHYFLTLQLVVKKYHEIWSLVGGQPIRFSLHEFAEITSLNSDPVPKEELNVEYRDFCKLIDVGEGDGPTYDELVLALQRCRTWSFEQRRMLGWLFVLSVGIYGLHHNCRIPLEAAKRVVDVEAFESYRWGRIGFIELVDSIKVVTYGNNSYTVHGCVHVLLIWIYESVAAFGERFGNKIEGAEVPLLAWGGSRPRTIFEVVIQKEVETYGEVRARNLILKPEEEIFPEWDDDVIDEELHNLVDDLMKNRSMLMIGML